MLLTRPLFDIYIGIELSNGQIMDLDTDQYQEFKERIVDPYWVEQCGPVTIDKEYVMSTICVGIN
jgi:hypothetical protein